MDSSFRRDPNGLSHALSLLAGNHEAPSPLPAGLPEDGIGEEAALDWLAPHVLGRAARLDAPDALAHMDPPTPWITWAAALWNASLNQNLLHPALSPFAAEAEARVIDWLASAFGMEGGHLTAGSTLANLTALWAARELRGVRRVVGSEAAHLSVPKAAAILGLAWEPVATDPAGALSSSTLPDLSDAALVLTAGTTSTGAVDPLEFAGLAAWTHLDAAWAGPLRLSPNHAHVLDGIEAADSVAISAHKWLFQPKDSALVLFRDVGPAHEAVSFGGAYLAQPNVGVQGSRGAVAVPLLATLLAWGRKGLAVRIDRTMALAEALHRRLLADPRALVFGPPRTGVLLWRPVAGDAATVFAALPEGAASLTRVGGENWLRHVAANPVADIEAVWSGIAHALDAVPLP